MDLSIERAELSSAEDIGRIGALSWKAAYRGIVPDEVLDSITSEARAERYRRSYSSRPDSEYYLFRAQGEPAGFAVICEDDGQPGVGQVGAFYFLSEYWGCGLARPAMEFCLARLKAMGYSRVILWVLEENARARRFYEKCGFVPDGAAEEIVISIPLDEIRYAISI